MTRFEAAIVFAFSGWADDFRAAPGPLLRALVAFDLALLAVLGIAAWWS